jgi:SAM-dependent methyltransferase
LHIFPEKHIILFVKTNPEVPIHPLDHLPFDPIRHVGNGLYERPYALYQYRTMTEALGIRDFPPLRILHPGCGTDTSVMQAFPKSEIWHVDPDEKILGLKDAPSFDPRLHHLFQGDIEGFEQGSNFDLVILRNFQTAEMEAILERVLKSGGLAVFSSHNGNELAQKLASSPTMQLTAHIDASTPESRIVLDSNTLSGTEKALACKAENNSGGKSYHRDAFIFRRVRKIY